MLRRRWLPLVLAGLIAAPLLAGLVWLGRELLRPIPPTLTPEPPRPTAPPTPLGGGGGLIAFVSQREGDLEVWVMRPDGANPRNLTRHPAQDYAPAWSPDGRWLAFLSDRADPGRSLDLYVMDAGGERVRRVTRTGNLAAPVEWSPDGGRLLARQIVGRTLRLFVVNTDGSRGRVRTVDPAAAEEHDLDAHWSPDGAQIAAVRVHGAGLALYVLDGHLDPLQTVEASPGADVNTFAWSPDGRRLAYIISWREAVRAAELWIADLETGAARTVRRFEGAGGFHGLAWSPDGRRLAVAWAGVEAEGQQLHVMWTDGSGLAAIGQVPGSQPEADWSPDSRWLVFATFLPFPLTPAPVTTAGPMYSDLYAVEVGEAARRPGALTPRLLTSPDLGQDLDPTWQP